MEGTVFSDAVISFFINTQDALGQLNSFQQKFSSSIGQMKNLLLGFVGFQGLRGAYSSLTKLVDVADKWHIPVEEVSEFSNLFATFGGNIDEATSAIETFQNMSKQLALHSSGPLKELSDRLGKNLFNKDYMAIIKDLREVYPRLTNNAKAEVQDLIGANAALRSMLESSNETWKTNTAHAKQMGVVSKENAQSIRDMRIALAELKTTLTELAIPFLEALKPVLEFVRDLVHGFNQLPDSVKKFAAQFVLAWAGINAALKTTALLATIASGGSNILAAIGIGGAAFGLYKGIQLYNQSESVRPELEQQVAATGTDPNKYNWLFGEKGPLRNWWLNRQIQNENNSAPYHVDAPTLSPLIKTEQWGGMSKAESRTTNSTTDNRVYNLTFNGIQNPDDFVNAFTSVAYNSTGPTRGWNNGI